MNQCCKNTYKHALCEVLSLILTQEITDMDRLIETLGFAIGSLEKAGH
jgi:hypothetical protein